MADSNKTCPHCGSNWSTAFFPQARTCPDCGKDLSSGSTTTTQASQADSGAAAAIIKRYRDAYLVARTTVGIGSLMKTLGITLGGLICLVSLILVFQMRVGEILFIACIVAIAFGIFLGMLLFILGVLISAQGQILKASLDSAVNTSPLLSNEQRTTIMSLPKL